MVAKRPPDISTQQWRTLQQGLAWYRKDRTITIADWLKALDVQPGELYPLARLASGGGRIGTARCPRRAPNAACHPVYWLRWRF